MKSIRKFLIIAFALAMALSMTITVYGSSGGKTTHLLIKEKINKYDTDQKTITEKECTTYKYDKNGLLKKIVQSPDSYGYSRKCTFVYNSKKQAIKMNDVEYHDGKKCNTYCRKYSYNKNGYVSRASVYWINNGKYELCCETRLTWNKKGQLTKQRDYDDSGKIDSIDRYIYSKKGLLIKSSHYDADDKKTTVTRYKYNKEDQLVKKYSNNSPDCIEWTYDGDNVTVTEYEDKSKNMLAFITYETYEHGDIIKDITYGGEGGTYGGESADYKLSTGSYDYMKIKLNSKYRKLVRKQQACLPYMW